MVQPGNDSKRQQTNNRERERERERDGEKIYTNQPSTVFAIQRWRIRSSLLSVKSGKNHLFHVSVFHLEAWNCPKKITEVARTICKVSAPKKVALKEGIDLITFGFGCQVVTSIPLKLQKISLPECIFSSKFRKFAKAVSKICAERKNRTRRLWLMVRCRNLWSNEDLPEYAFQAYISANLRTCGRNCDCNI